MLETLGKVVSTDGQYALVQAEQGNGCELCSGKGCGSGHLSRIFCGKPGRFRVDNRINAGMGDEVVIAVADGAVMRGIGLVYLLPMLLLVIGAMTGSLWAVSAGQHDAFAAAGALAGLVAGFVLAKWLALRHAHGRFHPYIARLAREDREMIRSQ